VEIASLIIQAYGLSKREGDILQGVLRGLSTAQISAAYHISINTVQDHCKSIFEKIGVGSRRELVAKLFSEQYQPKIQAGTGLDENGWFLSSES
jgi:DNA-binding CsgD family transcriptional regulator